MAARAAKAHIKRLPKSGPANEATRKEAGKQTRRGQKDLVATKTTPGHAAAADPNSCEGGSTGLEVCMEENWTPEQFVNLAKQKKHPMDEEVKVPPRIAEAIFAIATRGPSWVVKHRIEVIKYYTGLMKDLEASGAVLHTKLHPDVEKVVALKRILLFKQMLIDIDYDDLAVLDFLILGVPIVGKAKESNVWPKDDSKLPRCEVKHLWSTARQSQKDILNTKGNSDKTDEQLTKEVWRFTQDEVADGLLQGPTLLRIWRSWLVLCGSQRAGLVYNKGPRFVLLTTSPSTG